MHDNLQLDGVTYRLNYSFCGFSAKIISIKANKIFTFNHYSR